MALEGVDQMRRKLETLIRQVPREVGRALFQEAQIEKTESMRKTPVKFGPLRASHEVTEPEINGGDISVSIIVGGPSAPYALFVHENLTALHPVGEAKFLESTLLESSPHMASRVGRRIDLNRLVP
jgi:hypothetical protein